MFRVAPTLMRVARRTTSVPKRRFGGHGGDDHHHHAPLDTAYNAEYYQRFKLNPIPKDGIYRRPTVDGNAYGPWNINADIYSQDFSDMVPAFSRHGPPALSPWKAARHTLIALVCLWGPISIAHNFLGDSYTYTTIDQKHPGPIPELVSTPNTVARQLVVEMV